MTTQSDQIYQDNQRGRIILTFFYVFGLLAFMSFVIGYSVLNIMVADRIQDALQLSRIVPFAIITLSAILPLGLLLGFWMSAFAKMPLDRTFRSIAAKRGFILTFFYLLILIGFILMINEPIANMLGFDAFSHRVLVVAPIGGLLGGVYAYICAFITGKFSKVAKKYDETHKPGRIEMPN